MLRQPLAVWAIAFASTVSFMGIGLVDPILPTISRELGATAAQTMLLFTSYLLVTAFVMFFAGAIASRLGTKKTLLLGLGLIVVFAALCGFSGSVDLMLLFRGGWGFGNALFISTALAAIVGSASGGSATAIMLYEAALGVGLAVGPLVGGALGSLHWSAPFFGTAVLMAIGFIAIITLLGKGAADQHKEKVSWLAGFTALRNPALRSLALTALFYNFGFFILLAYSPYPVEAAAKAQGLEFGPQQLGLVFFGWGLAVAISSVLIAPRLTRAFGLRKVLYGCFTALVVLFIVFCFEVHSLAGMVTLIVISGLVLGILNTALTEAVMDATDLPRQVASSTYSGMRFLGGAIAPAVAGPVAAATTVWAPYAMAAVSLVIAIVMLTVGARHLTHLEQPHTTAEDEALAITLGDD
ncbi:MFS transporter [Granulicoccus phenolivorans]|uniref:MFS transporter n=1 Tax=Granulicoccus phenolivorans TaxID=266854 RepID=UPI00047BBBA5|nr:MFS transporter [Granulicoccus phenolivorans]